jgi:hypothetical protein
MRAALAAVALAGCLCAGELRARPVRLADAAKPGAAAAEPVVELLVLHATNQKKGIDARLRDLPELTRPPFSSYDSYGVLERVRLPLAVKHVTTHRLPNGRVLGTELVTFDEKDTVHLAASISEPGGGAFLPLLEVRAQRGQHFIVAGQKYQSGILVLVLTIATPG